LGLNQTGLFSVLDETPLELDLHVLEQVEQALGPELMELVYFLVSLQLLELVK
jgi:hypothetical protein